MTAHATPAEVAQLEEASDAIRSRAAHLRAIAVELEELVEDDVADELVVVTTQRLEELDQLLNGEVRLNEARAGIPGLDQIMERLAEDD
ncbi:MAG: hypothetical protein JWM86_787 [Thermoleophilia bacterium]|nr:hypothetical protein [Thermoleophilia bacterium]